MLYLIYGSDISKVYEKGQTVIKSMLFKKPNAALFKINTENWETSVLQELIGGQGLFENKYIIHISRVIEDQIIKEEIYKFLEDIKSSDNIFIWTEGDLSHKDLLKIEKYSEKVEVHNIREQINKTEFNIFSLADAIGNRDKKRSWILYLEALKYYSIEEIHGTIFWQIKSMIIVMKTKDLFQSGMKSFTYNKSKKFAQNYSLNELMGISLKLISVLHNSRRGICDLEMSLEKILLELK